MYKELVKRLRHCSEEHSGCGTCELSDTCVLHTKLLLQAADAIEELLPFKKQVEKGMGLIDKADELLNAVKPHWISVIERLPKTRKSILGKKSSKVIVAFRFNDGAQGTDTAHTLNREWVFEDHITVVPRTVTHWMPLPEPPKEEQA